MWILLPAYPLAEYLKKEPGAFCSLPFTLPQQEEYSNSLIDKEKLKALITLQVPLHELDFCETSGSSFFCRLKGNDSFCLGASADCILFIENVANCSRGEGKDLSEATNNASNVDQEGEKCTLLENRFLYYKPNGIEGWKKFLAMTISVGVRDISSDSFVQGMIGRARQAAGATKNSPIVNTGEVLPLARRLPEILQQSGMALGPDFLV